MKIQLIDERTVLGKDFKIYGDIENPLFLAKDVAEWIDYAYKDKKKGTRNVNMMLESIDESEKIKDILCVNNLATQDTHGGLRENTEMWFITEDGLYEVLMLSRKPIAKQFKKEVKKILKTIRQTGAYISNNIWDDIVNDPTKFGEFLIKYGEVKKKNELLEKEKNNLLIENYNKDEEIKELSPKATYYDRILNSKDLLTSTQISKDYGMSAVAFNKLLQELKIQYKQGGQWFLYTKYEGNEYTATRTYEYSDNFGVQRCTQMTCWTQKGRLFLYNFLKSKGYLPTVEKI